MSNFNEIVIKKLDRFIRRYYINRMMKGAIYLVAISLSVAIFLIILEYLAHFNTIIRTGIFYTFIAIFSYVFYTLLIIPVIGLYRIRNDLSYEQAASIIGNHFSEVKDKLMNLLQLHNSAAKTGDNALLVATIDQRITELKPIDFQSAIDLKKNVKYIKYALVPLAAFTLLGLVEPGMITEPSKRIVNYKSEFLPEAPFQFVLMNDKLSVVKNEDYTIELRMTGRIVPDEVYLDMGGVKEKMTHKDKSSFKYVLKNLQKSVNFKFESQGFESKEHELKVLPKPVLLSFNVELHYPRYLGMKDETLNNVGDLTVPEGTRISWAFNTENSETLRIILDKDTSNTSEKVEEQFEFNYTAMYSTQYRVITENQYHTNEEGAEYEIDVLRDEAPIINLKTESDSLNAGVVYCYGSIEDDHGFSGLYLKYRKVNKEEVLPFVSESIKYEKNSLFSKYSKVLDIRQLGLEPGEEVEYYFEVFDNDGVNGAKSARTVVNWIKLRDKDEMRREAEKGMDNIKNEMEEAIEEAKKINRDLQKLSKKLLDKKDKSWEDKQELNELIKKHSDLEREADNLKEKYKRNNELTSEYETYSEDLVEKQKEINELLDKIMTDEMKETMEEISKMLDEMDKEKLNEEIEKMAMSSEELEKELDRSLELMKQLEFEKKLETTLDKVEELKKEQEELKKETEEGSNKDAKENAERQNQLNEKFEEIIRDLEDLREKNEDMEFPNEMGSTEKEEKEVSESMDKSSEEMQKGNKGNAGQQQQKSTEGMESIAQSLQQTQAQMMEQQMEDIDNLRQLLDNVITASFDQEKLMEELKELSDSDPQYVQAMVRQGEIRDNIDMIEDSLFALSKRVVQLEPMVNREINAVNNSINAALKQLQERRTGNARRLQQLAMTSLNNLSLLLDEVVESMQQQMAMSMPGGGSCSKPGKNPGGKTSLSKMQQQLNEQLKQMKEGGKNEGKGKQEGGSQMSMQLAKMAARQAAIRQELRRMENSKEGEGGQLGEELKKISELMEQTETDIVNKRITNETLKRQEEITTRLLNSEKAEREQEWDNRRKSKEFQGELSRNDKELEEYYKKSEKEVELLRTMIPSYSSFYKKKVSEYFKSLSE